VSAVTSSFGALGARIARVLEVLRARRRFRDSASHWEGRYRIGGNSGPGSYGALAQFKAQVLNDFVRRHAIETVLELGCGDGNQLALAHYPHYRGYDVSRRAVEMCRARFRDDASKAFLDYDPQRVAPGSIPPAQLALSLDVVFHLVEDEVFDRYMTDLFAAASRFVIVYASNTDRNPLPRPPQIRHRRFTDWVTRCAPGWRLCEHVPNRHPFRGDARTGSRSEFFVFERGPG